ncbi:MAG TPA: hypothetical protein VF768_09940 [Holophagaceae bacterium]
MAIAPLILHAQGWDAATQAQGWARQDKDDSFTFYDPATKLLHTWMQDGGEMRAIPLGRLENPPSKWIIDPRGNAWVVAGTTLTQVEPDGHLGRNVRLPAEVGSVCWDTKGFVLSYKTQAPYLEKRRYQDGDVLWTFGTKPGSRDAPTALNLHPLLMDDLDHILLGNGHDLNLTVIGADSGKRETDVIFAFNGGPSPTLGSGTADRGPLCLWSGKNVAFASLPATDLPESARGSLQGQVLARLDLGSAALSFLPSGLDASYLLVGVLGGNAVFVNPKGGLVLVPVK